MLCGNKDAKYWPWHYKAELVRYFFIWINNVTYFWGFYFLFYLFNFQLISQVFGVDIHPGKFNYDTEILSLARM